MKSFIPKLSSVPTPLAGLALGIASLGWCMETAFPFHGAAQITGAVLAAVLLFCLLSKYISNHQLLIDDARHPVLGSILPTFSMALMVISRAVAIAHQNAAEFLWIFAVILHLLLLSSFVLCRFRRGFLAHMVPSWFIPPVGIIISALTCPADVYKGVAYTLLCFGLANFTILFPIMVYRILFRQEVPDAAKPTIAIFAAPASLSLAGYISLEAEPSLLVCSILLGIAMLMTLVIYIALLRLLRMPFTPGYASFTFPLVIGATALFKVAAYLETVPTALTYARQLRQVAYGELGVAAIIIAYVCARYIIHYASKLPGDPFRLARR